MVLPTLLPGHHPILNDFVVLAIAAHVGFFTFVIVSFVKSQFKSPIEDTKEKWN